MTALVHNHIISTTYNILNILEFEAICNSDALLSLLRNSLHKFDKQIGEAVWSIRQASVYNQNK